MSGRDDFSTTIFVRQLCVMQGLEKFFIYQPICFRFSLYELIIGGTFFQQREGKRGNQFLDGGKKKLGKERVDY